MPQSPEQAAAARIERIFEAKRFATDSRSAGIEPTLPRFHAHLRQKKAVSLGQPVMEQPKRKHR
ncbi:MAG: hypothetical protein AAB557_04125 [Patescibacteria group bacterium]